MSRMVQFIFVCNQTCLTSVNNDAHEIPEVIDILLSSMLEVTVKHDFNALLESGLLPDTNSCVR